MNLGVIVTKREKRDFKNLITSFFKFHPQGRIYFLTVDFVNDFIEENQNLISFDIFDLNLKKLKDKIFNFSPSITKLILKPYWLDFLFRSKKINKLILVEPQTLFYNSIEHLNEILDVYSILVTPYFLKSFSWDDKIEGIFDFRFLGVKNNLVGKKLIEWWENKVQEFLKGKVKEDYFRNQKFFDLLPFNFNQVYIIKEPGINVNFLNLKERKLTFENKHIFVNGKPLYFFTFLPNENEPSKFEFLVGSNFSSKILKEKFSFEKLYIYFQNIYDKVYVKVPILRWIIVVLKEPVKKLLFLILRLKKKSKEIFYSQIKQTSTLQERELKLELIDQEKLSDQFLINIVGFLKTEKGIGEAVRTHLRVIDFLKLNYKVTELKDYFARNIEKIDVKKIKVKNYNAKQITLLNINPDWIEFFYRRAKFLWTQSHYRIGYWVWESEVFPQKWEKYFNLYDEIWVPSTFCLKNLVSIAPIPVVLVPHSLAQFYPQVDYSLKQKIGLLPEDFVFFFMFDFCSYLERKNPLDLIKVFQRCKFPANVYLLIKTINKNVDSVGYRKLKDLSKKNKNIIIWDKVLKREEINKLLSEIDCYVSLHRAEGFGLTLLEAMNFGKPVIATGYSGNLDFMNEKNSFLVGYSLVENKKDFGPYEKGLIWAQPNLDEAEYWLRYVYENYSEALEKAKIGQSFVRENFSLEKISQFYLKRLNFIFKRL